MSDSYQPIFDAVRSRISNGDIGAAVEAAIRDANISHAVNMAVECIRQAAGEYERPSAVHRPKLIMRGVQWCAFYGDSPDTGVFGTGKTPAEAMRSFDVSWHKPNGGQIGGAA